MLTRKRYFSQFIVASCKWLLYVKELLLLHQERVITGITFCHQTGGPITGWAYNRDFTVFTLDRKD